MSRVPKHDVDGRVEDAMERNGQFYCSKVRAEVTTGLRHRSNDHFADLRAECVELLITELREIAGAADRRKEHHS